jgi:hypothetical protein
VQTQNSVEIVNTDLLYSTHLHWMAGVDFLSLGLRTKG